MSVGIMSHIMLRAVEWINGLFPFRSFRMDT